MRLTEKKKKNRNINLNFPKDKKWRTINNKNGDRKSLLKSKKEETKKSIHRPTKKGLFKWKSEKIKKGIHKPANTRFKWGTNETRKIRFD